MGLVEQGRPGQGTQAHGVSPEPDLPSRCVLKNSCRVSLGLCLRWGAPGRRVRGVCTRVPSWTLVWWEWRLQTQLLQRPRPQGALWPMWWHQHLLCTSG